MSKSRVASGEVSQKVVDAFAARVRRELTPIVRDGVRRLKWRACDVVDLINTVAAVWDCNGCETHGGTSPAANAPRSASRAVGKVVSLADWTAKHGGTVRCPWCPARVPALSFPGHIVDRHSDEL